MREPTRELEMPRIDQGETVCSEEEFRGILAAEVPILVHIDELVRTNDRARLSRRLLATVAEEAAELEDLLTDYDAPYNRTYSALFEFVAALGSLAAAGYVAKNIEARATHRGLAGDEDLESAFPRETESTLAFIEGGVRRLLRAVADEARRLCGPDLRGAAPSHIMQDGLARKALPHTVGAEESGDVELRIATEASLFLAAHKTLNERSPHRRFEDLDAMRDFVLETCDEEQSRFFEAKLANIQSRYDTFIMHTAAEQRDPDLRKFRFVVGTVLDLIRLVTRLVHFYERHEDDLRAEEARDRVTALVDKRMVLDRMLNYALLYAQTFMNASAPLAKGLLEKYTDSEIRTFDLPEGVVLHARPASLIAKVVQHHGTPVEMTIGDASCYAGSVMQVLLTAGSQIGVRSVSFRGDRKPVEHLALLFEAGLGESGTEALPPELAYLRD